MNDPINLSVPADILGYIPHLLGETPRESFVAITLQGNKLGATLRVDAPYRVDARTYAQNIVSYLTADEAATGALLVIYSNQNTATDPRPFSEHVKALINELSTARMPLKDAWMVTSESWCRYLCDKQCCPDEPLESITASTGNAAMIYRGSNITGFTAPPPFTGGPTAHETIAAHKPEGWPEQLEANRAAWAEVLHNPQSLLPQTAHQLAGALQHPDTRDHFMADIVTDAPEQFTSVFLGVFVTRPDWARVDTAQEVAFEIMKTTPEGQRAPMLTLIGWLEWLKGKSSFAARYFKLALEDRDGYRLAELLTEITNQGLLAYCSRTPEMAYTHPRA